MKHREGLPLLAEELELRGFLHLEAAQAVLPIVSTYAAVPSTLSRQDLPRAMRPTKLLLLAKALASPPLSFINCKEEEQGLVFLQQKPGPSERAVKEAGTNKRPGSTVPDGARGPKPKKLSKRALREQKQVAAAEVPPVSSSAGVVTNAAKEEPVFQPGQGSIVEAGYSSEPQGTIGSERAPAAGEGPAEELMELSREEWFFSGMEVAAGPGADEASAAAAATSSSAIAAVLPEVAAGLSPPVAVTAVPLSLFGAADSSASAFGRLLHDCKGGGDVVMEETGESQADGEEDAGPSVASVWTSLISPEPEEPHSFFSGLTEGTRPFNSPGSLKPVRSPSLGSASIWGWNGPTTSTSAGWPGPHPKV